ncbi:MAG: ferritin-like domain-containing protein [Myxococcales bacterium]|nr:ferritin-like domain-containing protein [Myxococcales bacterium]
MIPSSFAYVRHRLFVAMGIAPALASTACGGLVVFVEDDGSGGSGGGTTAVTTGATTVASTSSTGQSCPPMGTSLLCLPPVATPCPPFDTQQANELVTTEILSSCVPENPEFCSCTVETLDVVCGLIDKDGLCCYGADYTVGEICEGRPFTVDGHARLAPLEKRADWRLSVAVDCAGLPDAARRALADAWSTSARYEHASVASFARVALELLALGAPRDLVTLAQHAALDETDHAALAFGIASALAGESIGPGPLDIAAAMRTDVASIVYATVREGCIGETISAVFALAARDGATDPAVVAALTRIAEDELRHAELAWRTVAWAIEARLPGAREAALAAFAAPAAFEEPEAEPRGLHPELGRAFGVLSPADKAALARQALESIVKPSQAALFQGRRLRGPTDTVDAIA